MMRLLLLGIAAGLLMSCGGGPRPETAADVGDRLLREPLLAGQRPTAVRCQSRDAHNWLCDADAPASGARLGHSTAEIVVRKR